MRNGRQARALNRRSVLSRRQQEALLEHAYYVSPYSFSRQNLAESHLKGTAWPSRCDAVVGPPR